MRFNREITQNEQIREKLLKREKHVKKHAKKHVFSLSIIRDIFNAK